MGACWLAEIQERPSFTEISQELEEHISTSVGYDLPSRDTTLGNALHNPLDSEMRELVPIFSYSPIHTDKQETIFSRHSDPRYIGLYKVPRPVDGSSTRERRRLGNDDAEWWERSEMAAGQTEREGVVSRTDSPPHYVNEETPETDREVEVHPSNDDCRGDGNEVQIQEIPDYVNAPTEMPSESLETQPSTLTDCDGTDSEFDGYVQQDVVSTPDTAAGGTSNDDPDNDVTPDSDMYVDTTKGVCQTCRLNCGETDSTPSLSPTPKYVNVVTFVGSDGEPESTC